MFKKRKTISCILITLILLLFCQACSNDNVNKDRTLTVTVTPTNTPTVMPTLTFTPTPTLIPTPTSSPTPTLTPTPTPSPSPTLTPTPTPVPEIDRVGIETLTDRALTAVDLSGDLGAEINMTEAVKGVYLSWRYMSGDNENTSFTLYRNGKAIAENLKLTNYTDADGKAGDTYKVVANNDAELGLKALDTDVWTNYYQEFTLNTPSPQLLPDGVTVEFTAGDMSLADLDADGQYELVVKWFPDNGQDNSKSGYTGYTYLDGYDIDFATGKATQLWRIDLGPNIRSGAHYTQFMVWDMDNDGKAEVACKTADGSTAYKAVNGELVETGFVGACNSSSIPSHEVTSEHDYRTTSGKSIGYILNGPEYLTIFRGDTGEIIDMVDYYPQRGRVSDWGDSYGNRVDRFLACVAYLDGENPSMVFCRGYYTKVTMAAYRLIDGKLTTVWEFNSGYEKGYMQGNHGISVADVDHDEKDEIIYGSLVMDDNGKPLYSNGLGHGDAMQVGDLLPGRPGLESLNVYETKTVKYQFALRDLATGEILFGLRPQIDVGRGLTGDIDPRYEGEELWSSADKNVYSAVSTFENPVITAEGSRPSMNFSIYWDGDLLRELQDYKTVTLRDGTKQFRSNVTKWDYENAKQRTLLETSEFLAMVGTKEKMGIVADVIGDWREEIISRHATDRSKIRIYMSTIPTEYNVECLMQNELYRLGIAWQNVAYNQPPHLDYALTDGLKTAELTAEVTEGAVNITFTEASDGKYGHEVEGYEVYRKTVSGSYERITTLDVNADNYKDSTVKAGMVYSYKIAAIVDGKTSYYSLPADIMAK